MASHATSLEAPSAHGEAAQAEPEASRLLAAFLSSSSTTPWGSSLTMRSLLLALLAQLFTGSVAGHRDWWLQTLPKCWQSCFANTEDGCASSSCICQSSEDGDSYLPSAVACAVDKCDADWALQLVLGQLQLLCIGLHCAIPDDVMDAAYAVASGSDDDNPLSTHTSVAVTSTKKSEHKTSTRSGEVQELTSTVRSTFTRTTTDSSGHTVQIVVPIAIGPSGIVTGSIATSTLSGQALSTRLPSSAVASPSATAPSTTSLRSPAFTAPTASQRTESPARGNGSPFENMQATGCTWTFSISTVLLGTLLMLFIRL
ncbi:hypothetical protein EK21DRAFT_119007 [Setomelanomma holmii]|uniref:Extracellular membrane protein CFEM domain-containing protein n=1 Tax=Setomelanomma holmii TaxID=210430 RepID=A0A9P4GX92_9PLEO|nr:hypothetical protein EK21DRAFT_119007 [Setomelanomma holmii]